MAIEKTVSNLVESQFPAMYGSEGPDFMAFVKAYFEWLETEGNALFHSRRLLEYHDIDTTADQFLVHYKNKYINNMQFETAVQTRELVKHSLDLYRSKGTERSIDLFFKSVFGVPADVYFPAQDIFKTSSADWIEPVYLEVDPADNVSSFIGVQISGVNSGATAFVETFIRKKSKDSTYYTNIYYLTDLIGDFQTGEKIKATATGEIGPTIIGSLNVLTVTDGGAGYSVGDLVFLDSLFSGKNGKALVTGTTNISGKTTFTLLEGGWGYNSNSQVLISDEILTVSNVVVGTSTFSQFETLVQPNVIVTYDHLVDGPLAVTDRLFRVSSVDGTIYASGVAMAVSPANSTAGTVTVNVTDGSFDEFVDALTEDSLGLSLEDGESLELVGKSIDSDGFIYRFSLTSDESGNQLIGEDASVLAMDGPTASANVASVADATVTANIMLVSSNVTIGVSDITARFGVGEVVYQLDDESDEVANGTISVASFSGTNATLAVVGARGGFVSGVTLASKNSSTTGTVFGVLQRLGVTEGTGSFNANAGNMVFGLDSGASGTVSTISTGFGASFQISNTFLYESDVTRGVDSISDYLNVLIGAPDYGFPAPGAENINTVISDALTFVTETYGKISAIIVTSFGTGYDAAPYVVIYEPNIAKYGKRDYFLSIADATSTFTVGEPLTQLDVIKGIVKDGSNSSILSVERVSFDDFDSADAMGTEDSVTLTTEDDEVVSSEQGLADVFGLQSGSSALPVEQDDDDASMPIGINAVVSSNTTTSNGNVTSLKVVDSGFNYYTGETVTFHEDANSIVGSALVTEMKQGTAIGYYKDNDSLLSANKYLQDNDYYQEFSYEIRSGITLDRYADMLKNILHVAGTRPFARFVSQSDIDSPVAILAAEVTIV